MSNIVQTLRERGLLQDLTDPEFEKLAASKSIVVYAGFDPTSDSLHIGHMVSILILKHFQLAGHTPIAVVGGATGMVGDPSGRSTERNLLTREDLAKNVAGIRENLSRFLSFEGANAAIMANNFDWLGGFGFLDFLRDVGKYFRIGDMLSKDSVKRRLEGESGLSYTEFSYMLLQAYDFLHLYRTHKCQAQVGGSDQWGNITAGTELIRRVDGGQGYGLTTPLLTNSEGKKMGKTASGAVWLSREKFSPYEFYQFWIRLEDSVLENFLKMLTLIPLPEVAAIMAEHAKDPGLRVGQRRLAMELTTMVHGEDEARRAKEASEALFGGALAQKSDEELKAIFPDVPSVEIAKADLEAGIAIPDLLVRAGLVPSKSEARRLWQQGGVYLNNSDEAWPESRKSVGIADLASESIMVLRAGKKKYCLIHFR